jgi:uncharacterized protein YndB with AHSA1/START domain
LADYHFPTAWRIEGTREEVFDILGDAASLARWWPSVYLNVDVVEAGDEYGVGRVVALNTKGWLPYTLRWRFRVVESDRPAGLTLEADGDFVGRGVWTFVQDGAFVDVSYDWRIRADKPLLRRLSFVLRRLFELNHRWAMARGEESLRLELARRRARTAEIRDSVPKPPGPTWPHRTARLR